MQNEDGPPGPIPKYCVVDGRLIPPHRKRFCSPECALRYKREAMRRKREHEHRHEYECVICGKRMRLGRKRVAG